MRNLILTLLLTFPFIGSQAQDDTKQHFEIAIKKTEEAVRIKIFPKSVEAFESYRHNGIQCEITTEGNSSQTFKIEPAPASEWTAAGVENKRAGAAYDILFKKSDINKPTSIEEMVEANKILNYSHGFFLVLSCMDAQTSALGGMEASLPKFSGAFNIEVTSTHNAEVNSSWEHHTDNIVYTDESPEIFGFNLDHAVKIVWDHENYFHQVISYVIQEQNEQGNFVDMNIPNKIYTTQEQNDPTLAYKMMHLDSLSQNYVDHTYRLIGVDAFGDRMNASNAVTLHGKDLTPPEIPTRFSANYENGQGKLSWDAPADDIDRILVLRSETNEEGPFAKRHEEFLDNKAMSFTDEIEDPQKVYYYILLASDSAGNVAQSLPQYLDIPDDFPPNPPLDLTANVDSLGQVYLYWHHNENHDLRGYKVFRSEAPQQPFIQISKGAINSNVFYDHLNLKKHNPEIKYYVKALDKSYNHSISTDTITILRPDIVAPSAPILRKAYLENDNIHLAWIPSSANDVKQYIIKADIGEGWYEFGRVEANVNQVQLPLSLTQHEISFKVSAVDEVGNSSKDEATRKVILQSHVPQEFAFELSSEEGKVSVQWQNAINIQSVMIYRAVKDQPFRLLKKAKTSEQIYTDQTVIPGEKYQYKIAQEFDNGARSSLSAFQEIKVK